MDKNPTHPNREGGQVSATSKAPNGGLQFFDDLASFSQAAETATGIVFDFASLAGLHTNFLGQLGDAYLVLNIKDSDTEEPNNLLLLGEDKALLYSKRPPLHEAQKAFEKVLAKPYGRSTVLAFLTLSKVLASYKQRLESLIGAIRELEQRFDSKKYRDLAFEFERLDDQLEDFHDILLKLQESEYEQVETRHISFDYSVLIAESLSLQGRYRRRIAVLSELARDNEMRSGAELNSRIAKLNDVLKKLTALTIILMMPNLVASHFGMNFVFMPELRMPWAYPAVIISEVVLVATGLVLFRKIGWL
ncbi:MAG: CorA family divalent cation transporter [Dehalococcoidia bacterium]|nr:CorA family divalent cation transporter [Dehalococcoidia bacterium]